MRLELGSETILHSLRMFSMGCEWNLAKTGFGIVFEYFRSDAIGVWLRQILDLPQNIFDEMEFELG